MQVTIFVMSYELRTTNFELSEFTDVFKTVQGSLLISRLKSSPNVEHCFKSCVGVVDSGTLHHI